MVVQFHGSGRYRWYITKSGSHGEPVQWGIYDTHLNEPVSFHAAEIEARQEMERLNLQSRNFKFYTETF